MHWQWIRGGSEGVPLAAHIAVSWAALDLAPGAVCANSVSARVVFQGAG
jgi:hypothetical protein